MSVKTIEIEARLYERAAARAAQEGKTLDQWVRDYLVSWVGPEPPAVMMRETLYTIRAGDTLAKIALAMYGDAKKYTLIAEYNSITSPGMIRVGQQLRIPFTEPAATSTPVGRRFRFPLNKSETNYFKFGSLYPSGAWMGKPHPGVDFHEYEGANVYAIGEGTVLINQLDPNGYGHYLMIEHTLTSGAKVYSLYGHLQFDDASFTSPPVKSRIVGENVIIGREGKTGMANNIPHVHFEIKKTAQLGMYSLITPYNLNEYFYDPYAFINDPNNLYLPATA